MHFCLIRTFRQSFTRFHADHHFRIPGFARHDHCLARFSKHISAHQLLAGKMKLDGLIGTMGFIGVNLMLTQNSIHSKVAFYYSPYHLFNFHPHEYLGILFIIHEYLDILFNNRYHYRYIKQLEIQIPYLTVLLINYLSGFVERLLRISQVMINSFISFLLLVVYHWISHVEQVDMLGKDLVMQSSYRINPFASWEFSISKLFKHLWNSNLIWFFRFLVLWYNFLN